MLNTILLGLDIVLALILVWIGFQTIREARRKRLKEKSDRLIEDIIMRNEKGE